MQGPPGLEPGKSLAFRIARCNRRVYSRPELSISACSSVRTISSSAAARSQPQCSMSARNVSGEAIANTMLPDQVTETAVREATHAVLAQGSPERTAAQELSNEI